MVRNRFDTLSFLLPSEAIQGLKESAFMAKSSTDLETGVFKEWKSAKPSALPIGFSNLENHRNYPDWNITISAKALKDSYLEGIGLENFEQAMYGLGSIMNLDLETVFQLNAPVFRADVTANIPLENIGTRNKPEIMQALALAKRNPLFQDRIFQTKKNVGVTFKGIQTEKNYIKAYDKFLDLQKHSNKAFLKGLQHPARMLEQADLICRIESEHTNARTIRSRFNISEPRLLDLLDSSAKVNFDFLKKVIGSPSQLKLFDEILIARRLNQKPSDFLRLLGLRHFAKEADYQMDAIRKGIQLLYGFEHRHRFHYHWNGESKKGKAYGGLKAEFQAICESEGQSRYILQEAGTSNKIVQNILESLAA